MEENKWRDGYVAGQAKLAGFLLSISLDTVGDYANLLEHLKKVQAREEVVSNDVLGFETLSI